MAYVGAGEAPPGCVFCHALAASDDRERLVLRRAARAFLILNAYPYTSGHLMAVLNRHVATVAEATVEELGDALALVQVATVALRAEYGADGFNVGINQGRVAGAGIVDHLHVHVVPRWSGDANFMPVIGEVRVLPEALERTWERLRGRLGA
jgi:ATP adenylyltransferase